MFAVTGPVVSETTASNRPFHKCLGVLGEASRWDQVSAMGADGRVRSHARWVRAVDFAGAGCAQLGQDGQQIVAGTDSQLAAGGPPARDRGDLGSGLLIPNVQPAFAAYSNA